MIETYSVLNTIAASGADLTFLDAGYMNVANTSSSAPWINIPFLGLSRKFPAVPLGALHATAAIKTVTYTAAPATTYAFDIYAESGTGLARQTKRYRINYTSDATGADATIATKLTQKINAFPDLNVTVSGAASPLTLTGDAGYEIFQVYAIGTTTTIAAAMTIKTIVGCTNATPVVVESTAHGLVVGDTVTIAGMATSTALNGLTFRLSAITDADHFTLEDSVAAGAGTGGTATRVAQYSRGSYADLSTTASLGATSISVPLAGTASTGSYGKFIFTFGEESTDLNEEKRKLSYRHTFYYNESDTDYVALRRKMMDFLESGVSGTPTTSNPASTSAA